MNKDILFLLDPEFETKGYRRFCPDCALVRGFLEFYPEVKASLDIRMVAPPRPRAQIVELLDEEHQGAPVLILNSGHPLPEGLHPEEVQGRIFLTDEREILLYLGLTRGVGVPLSYEG